MATSSTFTNTGVRKHDDPVVVEAMRDSENAHDKTDMAYQNTLCASPVDTTTGSEQISIPLQTLSPVAASSPSSSVAQTLSQLDQSRTDQDADSREAAPLGKRVSTWIWRKGCVLWSWVMSIVMMALTVVTYLITKLQGGMSSTSDAYTQYMQASDEWKNKKDWYNYCREQKVCWSRWFPGLCELSLCGGSSLALTLTLTLA